MNENIYIVNLLSQYRELNTLYRNVVDNLILNFDEQCRIVDFYNEFIDTANFDRAILNLILTADKDKQAFIIDNARVEIGNNIALYIDNQVFLDSINSKSIYADRHNPIQEQIDRQLGRTQELWQKLKQIRGSLEAQSWQNNNQTVEKLSLDENFYEKQEKEEQEKLDILYTQKKESDAQTSKYRENIFYKINDLNNSFLTIIENYFPIEKESEEEVVVETELVPEPSQIDIDPDTIFRTGMFERFLVLEQQLIKDNYLDDNLNWVSKHDAKRIDIKSLVTFLIGLLCNNYFLPGRDTKIRQFFENRYNIKIGQNFEENRRRQYIDKYQSVFLNCKF